MKEILLLTTPKNKDKLYSEVLESMSSAVTLVGNLVASRDKGKGQIKINLWTPHGEEQCLISIQGRKSYTTKWSESLRGRQFAGVQVERGTVFDISAIEMIKSRLVPSIEEFPQFLPLTWEK